MRNITTESGGQPAMRNAFCAADDIISRFLEAMRAAGVNIDTTSSRGPSHPIADGKLHRANALGKRSKKNGHVWYILHVDGVPAGAFGDLALGVEDTWSAKKPASMTAEEKAALRERMKRAREERKAAQAELNRAAAEASGLIMKVTTKADPAHPYLAKKGLQPFPGLRQIKADIKYVVDPEEERPRIARAGWLAVPVYTPAAELVGVQLIQPDGTKRFIKGMAKEGNYHPIGAKPTEENSVIVIGEGYATCAQVHAATGFLSIVAFDAGNLVPVATAIRNKYPRARIVIAADNDRMTVTPVENPGLTKAREAAEKIKARVAYPEFDDGDITSTDFDDLARLQGLGAVRDAVDAGINGTWKQIDLKPERNSNGAVELLDFERTKERRTIRVVKGAIHRAVDEAIEVLSDPEIGIFQRGETLVRVALHEPPSRTLAVGKASENVQRPDGAVVIRQIGEAALAETLTRHANFTKWDGRAKDDVAIDCPPDVSRMLIARRGEGWTMPHLRAVIQAPTLRHNGTVIAENGYDAATGLLLVGNRLWRSGPESPTRRDALDALDILVSPITALPYVDNNDRAAALALLITAVLRTILPTAPMFAVTAPAAGTGKSLTIDVAAIMATGRSASVVTPTSDEAELEKRIGAAALAGDPVLSIDNVSTVLRSDQLCQFLTQSEVQVRILGKSENIKVPSTALICATGNNLSLYGDLNRRTIRIRLDARCERPDERAFSFDARELARQKRSELVAAALTIVRAYIVAGTPGRASPMGSFEVWSDTVRSALMWLDMGDCRGDVEAMRAEDPEKAALAEVIEALPSGFWTVKDIRHLVGADADAREALATFIDRSGVFNAKRFAWYLRRHSGTIVAGRSIVMASADPKHGATWLVSSDVQ